MDLSLRDRLDDDLLGARALRELVAEVDGGWSVEIERIRPAASVGLPFSLVDADELGRGGYL